MLMWLVHFILRWCGWFGHLPSLPHSKLPLVMPAAMATANGGPGHRPSLAIQNFEHPLAHR